MLEHNVTLPPSKQARDCCEARPAVFLGTNSPWKNHPDLREHRQSWVGAEGQTIPGELTPMGGDIRR